MYVAISVSRSSRGRGVSVLLSGEPRASEREGR